MDHAPDLDLVLAQDLASDHALGVSPPVRARDDKSAPGGSGPHSQKSGKWHWFVLWPPAVHWPRGGYVSALGESKAPAAHELEAQIPETPAQMRELVQVLGPVAVTDMVEAALGPWPGLTRADVEAMVHRRFHGTWWAWDAPAGLGA